MNKKTFLAIAGFALAALAVAQIVKHKDWAKSPEAYFLTPAERTEWSKITNDADAEKFIATYWAKRGGERFREEIERRIAAADQQFKLRRQRGAESARGRLLVTLGSPSRVSRTQGRSGEATPDTGPGTAGGTRPELFGSSSQTSITQTWIYDKDKFDPSWGIGDLRAQIDVDQMRGSDELQRNSAVDRAIAVVAEKSIVNPSATGAAPATAPAATQPSVPAVAGTGPSTVPAPASAAPPPAPAAAALPAATRASLEALLKTTKAESGFWGGPFHGPTGEPFYALEFYFSGEKTPPANAKFGGVVTSESGGEAASFWEDASFSDMKTGTKADKVYERSIPLAPGSYRGAFGIFPADGAAAVESASVAFKIEPKGSAFEVSPLVLTNELKPLTKRPGPTDPFVFGVEKPIRVEPKGDRIFSKQDSLWYFYAVENPKLPESAAPSAPSASVSPAPSATPGASPAPAAEAKPRIMQRIGVLRDGKPAFAPFTGPAEMQMLAAGYYASGSEIPLATFEPGYYSFTLNVRDLNAPRDSLAFRGIDRQAEFVVLRPDGSLPEKAAAKPAPATPKPRPKKS